MKAPDGGWGWAVLIGGFVITGFSYAFPKAVSVFYKELMHEFGVGYSDTAWISSILLAMLYGTGPVCSVLVNRFGCRPVMMVGGLFASLGMILASFATSIIHIYLCTGVITGLGLSLNFQPSLIMLNRYFNKKRPLANGLAAAGSPVALCCLSPLGQLLSHHYGWRGGFLILGGLLLNCCACGALMRPLVAPCKPGGGEVVEASVEESETPAPKKKKKPLLDFSVFRDRGFLIYTLAASIMVLGLFVPPVYVVSYAKYIGIEDTKAALLLTILGFVDMFARPLSGLLAGTKWVRPRCVYLFGFAMVFNGCTDLFGSQATTYPGLVVFCIFFGISYGMVGALQFEVLMAIVGSEKFSSAIGLVLLMEAIAVLVGVPVAGLFVQGATKNFMYVFLMAGCEVTLSAVVLVLGTFFCLIKKKKKEEEPEAKLEMAVNTAEMLELRGADQEEEEEAQQQNKGGAEGKEDDVKEAVGEVETIVKERENGNLNPETSL